MCGLHSLGWASGEGPHQGPRGLALLLEECLSPEKQPHSGLLDMSVTGGA